MPFKIKDLMINIVLQESGEGTGECVTEKNTNQEGGCTGKHTDLGCTGKHTDLGCTGNHTDIGCTGKHTDVVACVGGRTDIELCIGGNSYGGREAVPACARCTVKSHKIFSFKCGPGEALDELNAIKAELLVELAAVNDEIREIEDGLHPKTVEEVQELETKLREALDELGKIKAGLEKK